MAIVRDNVCQYQQYQFAGIIRFLATNDYKWWLSFKQTVVNLFNEIQKLSFEFYTRMRKRKEKNQKRKEKLMAVGL